MRHGNDNDGNDNNNNNGNGNYNVNGNDLLNFKNLKNSHEIQLANNISQSRELVIIYDEILYVVICLELPNIGDSDYNMKSDYT